MNVAYSYSQQKSSETVAAAHGVAQRRALSFTDNRPSSVVQRRMWNTASQTNTAARAVVQLKTNSTGLPDDLKSGIENLSGHSMDDVKVHYHSSKPAQLNAHAYAQGNQIHVASGQEKHLAHEAWHVVQQKQGRVKPTLQMKGKVNVNDESSLEKEADVMGAKAMQLYAKTKTVHRHSVVQQKTAYRAANNSVAQLKLDYNGIYTAANVPAKTPNQFNSGAMPHTGAVRQADIYVTRAGVTSDPADLNGMERWKDLGYLKDPSKSNGQTLTRMHAIRGRFGGPSQADNMFLGTAFSNNFNSGSHYAQVEKPIQDFLGTANALGVDYTVAPHYGTQPAYIVARYNTIADPVTQNEFQTWAENALPATFTCYADFYKKDAGGNTVRLRTSETLPADIGATVGPTALVLGGAVGGVGLGAAALGGAALLAAPLTLGVAALGLGVATALKFGGYNLRPRILDDDDT